MRSLKRFLITGGAGFIGSNLIRYLFGAGGFDGVVVNLDKLTYAGNLENLLDVDRRWGGTRYFFYRADVCDFEAVRQIMERHEVDTIVHLAAESHVDRSIFGPQEFVRTNVNGTATLLEVSRELWRGRDDVLFHHVSTDEVFGSLSPDSPARFTEETAYAPRSPYAASKASSDHLVRAYHHTFGLPVTVTNCSNNYGPYQFPEKLMPLMILNIFESKPLPVYGDGSNVRDWLHVEDHARAIYSVLSSGETGQTYLVGGDNEWTNLRIVNLLCDVAATLQGKPAEQVRRLITFVSDRPGHDKRYAVASDRIRRELGWKPGVPFEEGIRATVRWYRDNAEWVARVRSGAYRSWIEQNYAARGR